jgi:hypothetical protein
MLVEIKRAKEIVGVAACDDWGVSVGGVVDTQRLLAV